MQLTLILCIAFCFDEQRETVLDKTQHNMHARLICTIIKRVPLGTEYGTVYCSKKDDPTIGL